MFNANQCITGDIVFELIIILFYRTQHLLGVEHTPRAALELDWTRNINCRCDPPSVSALVFLSIRRQLIESLLLLLSVPIHFYPHNYNIE